MKRYIFTLSILFLVFSPHLNAETIQLKSFSELLDALNRGEKVNAVMHYADCKLTIEGKDSKSPDQIGGIPMMPFEYYGAGVITKKGFVSSSQTTMIYLAGANAFLYNYVKVRVYDDNTVEITIKFVTTDKFEVKSDEMFTGEINDGTNGKGVYFFIEK
jgi:hypothetical protein